MSNSYIKLFRPLLITVDLFLINSIHLVLMMCMQRIDGASNTAYLVYFLNCNIIWLICGYLSSLYIDDGKADFLIYAKRSFKAFTLYLMLIMSFIFFYHYSYSRLFIIISLSGWAVALAVSRSLFLLTINYRKGKRGYEKKVIVLGYNEISKKLVSYFLNTNELIAVDGFFENYDHVHELSSYPILGDLEESVTYAIENNVNEIYSTISPEKEPALYELANDAERNLIRFKFVPDLQMFVNRNFYLDYNWDIPILSLRAEPLEDVVNRIKKRAFDIIFSCFVIVFILSWLLPILALLVKLSSPGPVFFVQLRSGKNNRQFKCYKFRSLRVNKDSDLKQVTKNDNRYTKIGKLLRKTNLDEMPQFINVLKGDMSIVGPRPHMLSHTESFSRVIGEYMIRHFVKPGITGWAQIHGFRGEIHEDEQLRQRILHDIWYLENWTIWLDIRIIILTVYNVFAGEENAY